MGNSRVVGYTTTMHDLQKILLKRLLDQNNQRYASLARGYDYDDNVVFHLKQLITKGWAVKVDSNYKITAEGVKQITQFDLSDLADTGFKTFFIGFVCEHDGKYLIKEHPAGPVNFYNLPSGKPQFGEPIGEALARTFAVCSGVTLEADAFSFRSLHLKIVKTSDGEVLFDDAFTIYDVSLPNEVWLKPQKAVFWADREAIAKLPNRWPEIDRCILEDDHSAYRAYEVVSDYILG